MKLQNTSGNQSIGSYPIFWSKVWIATSKDVKRNFTNSGSTWMYETCIAHFHLPDISFLPNLRFHIKSWHIDIYLRLKFCRSQHYSYFSKWDFLFFCHSFKFFSRSLSSMEFVVPCHFSRPAVLGSYVTVSRSRCFSKLSRWYCTHTLLWSRTYVIAHLLG